MREILFRGKRIDNGEWAYGSFLQVEHEDGSFTTAVFSKKDAGGDAEVDPSTVGQYTAHTDKNGKRIFEGDIIRYIFDSPDDPTATENGLKVRTGRIFWSDWSSSFALTGGINGSASLNNVEVIGNIYDNPELLEDNRS